MSGQVIISPQNPAVVSGASITLTSNTPVSWSLNGIGSLSNVTATSVTFTAPSGVTAKNQMLGCPVGPNDSVFNTRVDNLPVHSRSNAYIQGSTTNPTVFEVDNWGISIADANTPTRTMRTYYSNATLQNFVMPTAGPNLKRQGGAYVGVFADLNNPADHHVMTVRHTDCTFYETYDDYLDGYTRACRDGSSGCNVQSAVTYSSSSYAVPGPDGGPNAAAIPLAPIYWQLSEIQSGSINHATTFTTNLGSVAFNKFVWPAAGTAGGCDIATCPNAMPMGTRLRLKGSFNQAAVCNSGVAAQDAACNTMLTGLKEYGMILSDTGLANAVQLLSEVTEDPVVAAAVQQLSSAGIAFTNFEAVDESNLEINADSYQVCPKGGSCLNGSNSFVAPTTQAIVTASTLTGVTSAVPIAVQAVAIGLGIPTSVGIATGSYSYQIPSWVNGSSNQNVTWSLLSGPGTVTTGGVYSPPLSTSSRGVNDLTILQGVSQADPAARILLHLNVIQAASNGALRIDTGALGSTTDTNGNTWAPDIGIEGGANDSPSDYPHWNKTEPAKTEVYESMHAGADLGNTIIVPNGTYDVHLLFGLNTDGACNSSCSSWLSANSTYDGNDFAPYVLETQGQVQSSTFDWPRLTNYMYMTPADAHVPAVVTGNLLQVYVRSVMSDLPPYNPPRYSKISILSGLEITSSTSASAVQPAWSIDTGGQSSISPGQVLLPFSVATSGGAPNDPTWSIVTAPSGAALQGSTLSLAANATPNSQPIVVQASDGNYSARASIATPATLKAPSSSFKFTRVMTISHAAVGSEDLSNFPVVISMQDPALADQANGGHVKNPNGFDIVFASDASGHQLLSWEVESYDSTKGTLVAHVLFPTVSHTADTVFYLLYGNSNLTTSKAVPTLVWDSNFLGVYHFSENSQLFMRDSSWHSNSALNNNMQYASQGKISGAASAVSTSATFSASLLDHDEGTVEAWISNNIQNQKQSWVLLSQAGKTSRDYFRLGWNGSDSAFEAVWSSSTAGFSRIGFTPAQGNFRLHPWNHFVYTWDADARAQALYLNGVQIAAMPGASVPILSTSSVAVLGANLIPSVNSLDGLVDELRVSNIVRSGNWIAAEYANQSNPESFVSASAEQTNN